MAAQFGYDRHGFEGYLGNVGLMRVPYDLRKDSVQIERIQNATLTTDHAGIQQTHGLFGSEEWWSKITSGDLKTHTLRGTISKVFSMCDWPEIEVTDSAGNKFQWTRWVNQAQDDSSYIVGSKVEIDYVIQRHKEKSVDGGAETQCVIQIRVEE